jgi:O-antigen ligase
VLVAAAVGAAEVRNHSARRATSDRSRRVVLTARVWERRPVAGVGLGAQPLVARNLDGGRGRTDRYVSHTTPLTIAAELGVVGLLLYAALLAGAAKAVWDVERSERALGLTLAAALLALFVHSLSYSGFVEDPLTWFVLALAAAALAARRPRAEREPLPPTRAPALTG